MESTSRRVCLAGLLVLTACGSAPRKFDPTSPITVRSGTLEDSYEQGGQPLDQADMVDQLGKNPATESDIGTAKTLGTIAMIGAVAGGALVGYPLGQAAAGQDPLWPLAAVGGGIIVISLPIGMWSSSKVAGAVRTHNEQLQGPKAAAAAR
jgi:hypothetical protein